MNLKNQRRLAASVLDVGKNRIYFDPESIEDIDTAITRNEIRKLINDGVIKALPLRTTSRGRARVNLAQKKAKRRKGPGSRKGAKFSVISRKTRWIGKIRSQRRRLKRLRKRRTITVRTYRNLYRKAKGGIFRSVAELERYITENDLRRRAFG
ncbi:50S ribosomal protein L19e [Candidatus Bathyarchaeota archaeon]|jgi:large subunit ribosomal protein L19e|nr:50S ribosomal protein L19e [Candidatus Bathyarchaeota archaeon]MDP6049149.1 50S ribosomal protein L19e [Candidatus Bathyarchaeota archaeon]MDP7207069.1 50S ribosomal protein L19e [Candidatus Bathyarchaeota archaeon]|tara:strand:+ start:2966 stop:3424 length:459 start_codon:yes stop_codon:yes gene_type:complete